jgi:NitT/TauT family transport system substrate-binding protein
MAMGLARRTETLGVYLLLFYGLAGGAQAAERAPANVILDFIVGGKHAPWYVALEKGFYAKRGLAVAIQPSAGSADALRTIGSGGGDFGFVDLPTMIVAKSRGMAVVAVAQLGYVGATILWRDEGLIKTIKDLEGKSLAIGPGLANWYLMPAFCRINNIDFKSIKIQETAGPMLPAALVTRKVDFISMFRASNDEVTERAAAKLGIKLARVYMKDAGLDIYGSVLIVKEDDVKKRPEFVRAYVAATLEGLRYARENQEEGLKILLKHKPELDPVLTAQQFKNAVTEVFLPPELVSLGLGFIKPEIMEKTVKVVNEYFDVGRKITAKEVYTNQFLER